MIFKADRRPAWDSKTSTDEVDTRFSNAVAVRGEQGFSCGLGYSGSYYQSCSLGRWEADRYSSEEKSCPDASCVATWGQNSWLVETWIREFE